MLIYNVVAYFIATQKLNLTCVLLNSLLNFSKKHIIARAMYISPDWSVPNIYVLPDLPSRFLTNKIIEN